MIHHAKFCRMAVNKDSKSSYQRILKAACEIFANYGYEGASVQKIVRVAQTTKPTLYYYFGSKAGLYKAIVDRAHDERFQLMQQAAAQHETLEKQLMEILRVLFRFARRRRDFTRLLFVTAFASQGEIPNRNKYFEKGKRNFEFVHSLIKRGLEAGKLNSNFSSQELTTAIFSQILFYAVTEAIQVRRIWKRPSAEQVIQLFLRGAASQKESHS